MSTIIIIIIILAYTTLAFVLGSALASIILAEKELSHIETTLDKLYYKLIDKDEL